MAEEAYIIVLKPLCENSTEETLYWGYLQGILENINILNVCERSVCITVFASFFFFCHRRRPPFLYGKNRSRGEGENVFVPFFSTAIVRPGSPEFLQHIFH